MNLLRSLRRLDDVVLARLGFTQPRRYAAGGLILGATTTVHLYPGEKILPVWIYDSRGNCWGPEGLQLRRPDPNSTTSR